MSTIFNSTSATIMFIMGVIIGITGIVTLIIGTKKGINPTTSIGFTILGLGSLLLLTSSRSTDFRLAMDILVALFGIVITVLGIKSMTDTETYGKGEARFQIVAGTAIWLICVILFVITIL